MKIENLHELLVHELEDLYSAEHQLLKALPKLAKAATSGKLKKAFESHLLETENHVTRLKECFSLLNERPRRHKCKAMEGLIAEGQETMDLDATPEVMDAALIGSAQRCEHYEIAAYGTARTFAETCGYKEVAQLLKSTLDEEKAADEKLTQIADPKVNVKATEPSMA